MPVMRIYISSRDEICEGRYPTVRNYVNMNLRNPDEVAIIKVDDYDYDYYLMRCSVSPRGAIIRREVGKVKIIEGV